MKLLDLVSVSHMFCAGNHIQVMGLGLNVVDDIPQSDLEWLGEGLGKSLQSARLEPFRGLLDEV